MCCSDTTFESFVCEQLGRTWSPSNFFLLDKMRRETEEKTHRVAEAAKIRFCHSKNSLKWTHHNFSYVQAKQWWENGNTNSPEVSNTDDHHLDREIGTNKGRPSKTFSKKSLFPRNWPKCFTHIAISDFDKQQMHMHCLAIFTKAMLKKCSEMKRGNIRVVKASRFAIRLLQVWPGHLKEPWGGGGGGGGIKHIPWLIRSISECWMNLNFSQSRNSEAQSYFPIAQSRRVTYHNHRRRNCHHCSHGRRRGDNRHHCYSPRGRLCDSHLCNHRHHGCRLCSHPRSHHRRHRDTHLCSHRRCRHHGIHHHCDNHRRHRHCDNHHHQSHLCGHRRHHHRRVQNGFAQPATVCREVSVHRGKQCERRKANGTGGREEQVYQLMKVVVIWLHCCCVNQQI